MPGTTHPEMEYLQPSSLPMAIARRQMEISSGLAHLFSSTILMKGQPDETAKLYIYIFSKQDRSLHSTLEMYVGNWGICARGGGEEGEGVSQSK